MRRIKINDPEAAGYHFPFQLGDIVEHANGGSKTRGKIIDGVYVGPSKERGGSYRLIYRVKRENGGYYNAEKFKLKKIPYTEKPGNHPA